MAKKQTNRPLTPSRRTEMVRNHRITFMMNDDELGYLQLYMDKYKVSNTSKFLREAVMRTVLQQLDKDCPTLF